MYREENYNRQFDENDNVRRRPADAPSGHAEDARRRQLKNVAQKESVFDDGRRKKNGYDDNQNNRRKKPKAKRVKKRGGSKLRKIILIIVLALALILGGIYAFLASTLNTQDFPKDDESLGITSSSHFGVTNIAFFGVDARDNTDTGRSDAIMVLSVDMLHGKIDMTSILRDSKVPIDGHGTTKINAAYAYGGPELAVKTLNEVYGLDIKEYATVDFDQLKDIVDAVGGVTINISDKEVTAINELMDESYPDGEHVSSSGDVLLNGQQAICYSRIRKIDTDNARAGRQQAVLSAVFTSLKNMSKLEYPSFIRKFAAIVKTSLSAGDVMKLMPIMFENFTIVQNTIPDEKYETDLVGGIDRSDGVWYWTYDLDEAAQRIHEIIYGSGE